MVEHTSEDKHPDDCHIISHLGTILTASSPLGQSYMQEIRHPYVRAIVVDELNTAKYSRIALRLKLRPRQSNIPMIV